MDEGPYPGTESNQTPNATGWSAGVRRRGISFVVGEDVGLEAAII